MPDNLFSNNQPDALTPTPDMIRKSSSNRSLRIFISSTFKDMIDDRDELMAQVWPKLRALCRERQVELTEVDLRWGVTEEQSTRKETLKLCLDEIHKCRPFFIGLLGERYGWTPRDDTFTKDLMEEQGWLAMNRGKSVTELEILHGALNNPEPEMEGRIFFYFRDPAYAKSRGADFLSNSEDAAKKQDALKSDIRKACKERNIPLHEDYADPRTLAELVLKDIEDAIKAEFPKENVPDPLIREEQAHEAFAETRRRTYIGRPDYYSELDRHAMDDDGPLSILGESGGGKSALVANWVKYWKEGHKDDFVFQHYVGGTPDSAGYLQLMTRLMVEIKRWTNDPDDPPKDKDEIIRDFPLWLSKARIKAERNSVRFIIVIDALNQLDDEDRARSLVWLPSFSFMGPLRLMVSSLPGEAEDEIKKRGWKQLKVKPLTPEERGRMIDDYLRRFAKKLDPSRVKRLSDATQTENPLYLKVLLDELRVTGTFEGLDDRISEYLKAPDIPALQKMVLQRYERDYERYRPGIVGDTLSLIRAARRGLSENELLRLLHPEGLPQLQAAIWSPLHAAIDESLVDRGGILYFVHDYLCAAVDAMYIRVEDKMIKYRKRLADFFEAEPVDTRTCDELPWLLREVEDRDRLRVCLLDIDRVLLIKKRDNQELMSYWVWLKEERIMGKAYLESFDLWSRLTNRQNNYISYAANELGNLLNEAALFDEAEQLYRLALKIDDDSYGPDHRHVAIDLNSLACLLHKTNQLAEAESMYRRALEIDEKSFGKDHPRVATVLTNLAHLLRDNNRLAEAEPLMRRSLAIAEQRFGSDHPNVATTLNTLALLLKYTNRLTEAESLLRRALAIDEQHCGKNHPVVARDLNNLAQFLQATNNLTEAETMFQRIITIFEASYGKDHPHVATALGNLAGFLKTTNRLAEAEQLCRRALVINEQNYGRDHPDVARELNNLASLLQATNRLAEAEPIYLRALAIDEQSYGKDHPEIATDLNNLASLFIATNRLSEVEPLIRRMVTIYIKFTMHTGHPHPHLNTTLNNYLKVLMRIGYTREQAVTKLNDNVRPYGMEFS
jgi:nephrocystin-3